MGQYIFNFVAFCFAFLLSDRFDEQTEDENLCKICTSVR